jgi:Zn ribbon nucleic-acid-binding protein
MKIVSNCPLCEEKSLHVIEEDGIGTQQCINCGYGTTSKFIGTKEDNEMYKTLPEEMQGWAKEANDRIWIPTMFTLPFGTLYPTGVEEVVGDGVRVVMKWGFANMVDIPEEEQKNYPDERGGYYKQMYDTENTKIYDVFLDAMIEMNARAKELNMNSEPTVSLDNGEESKI